jgi:hypothetical protein
MPGTHRGRRLTIARFALSAPARSSRWSVGMPDVAGADRDRAALAAPSVFTATAGSSSPPVGEHERIGCEATLPHQVTESGQRARPGGPHRCCWPLGARARTTGRPCAHEGSGARYCEPQCRRDEALPNP